MTVSSPVHYRQPAEWAPHHCVWLAWPSDASLWEDALPAARVAFVALARGIADLDGDGRARGESLEILVPDADNETLARESLRGLPVRLHRIPFGDIWMRDIAPIFVHGRDGATIAAQFRFNGWGGKYVLPHDDAVSASVARACGLRSVAYDYVLEGGSVEVDGEGTILTSEQCLLNPNRNPTMDRVAIERALCEALGGTKVLWVSEGLINDHTDGHIDTIARYVAPGVIAAMEPTDGDDPNAAILRRLIDELEAQTDAAGRQIRVARIPSPGRVLDEDGEVMPASHLNFYIANTTVIVPTYGTSSADAAVAAVGKLFPGRRAIGVDAKAILEGGGAFHCITQQQPSAPKEQTR